MKFVKLRELEASEVQQFMKPFTQLQVIETCFHIEARLDFAMDAKYKTKGILVL